eukprot:scaffold75080_cov18-Phaeocystis_antarctica.AAC.1
MIFLSNPNPNPNPNPPSNPNPSSNPNPTLTRHDLPRRGIVRRQVHRLVLDPAAARGRADEAA